MLGKGATLLHLQKDCRADKKQHSVQVRCSKIASMQIFLGNPHTKTRSIYIYSIMHECMIMPRI